MPDTELIYVKTNIGGYFFDGFIDHEHQDDLEITSHPVQNGANVADHAYLKPATLTMHIKMSDVLTDIVPGQFVKDYTRSVSPIMSCESYKPNGCPSAYIPDCVLTKIC